MQDGNCTKNSRVLPAGACQVLRLHSIHDARFPRRSQTPFARYEPWFDKALPECNEVKNQTYMHSSGISDLISVFFFVQLHLIFTLVAQGVLDSVGEDSIAAPTSFISKSGEARSPSTSSIG